MCLSGSIQSVKNKNKNKINLEPKSVGQTEHSDNVYVLYGQIKIIYYHKKNKIKTCCRMLRWRLESSASGRSDTRTGLSDSDGLPLSEFWIQFDNDANSTEGIENSDESICLLKHGVQPANTTQEGALSQCATCVPVTSTLLLSIRTQRASVNKTNTKSTLPYYSLLELKVQALIKRIQKVRDPFHLYRLNSERIPRQTRTQEILFDVVTCVFPHKYLLKNLISFRQSTGKANSH